MGIIYTFGIFLSEFMETFGTDQAVTSTQMGVLYLVGPIGAYLVDKVGCCKTAITGSILASTGLIISGVSPNFATLCSTAGFLSGIFCDIVFLNSC